MILENHMHHIDFPTMSKAKQARLMDNKNFGNLMLLWKADVFGSHPVRADNLEKAEKIYEEYRTDRASIKAEEKKVNIIPPEQLMDILKSEGLEMKDGILKFKNYTFYRAIPAIMEYLENFLLNKERFDKSGAEERVRKLIRTENILEKIEIEIENDSQVDEMKKEMENISGKKKNSQKRKLEMKIGQRANEIFDTYFEKLQKKREGGFF